MKKIPLILILLLIGCGAPNLVLRKQQLPSIQPDGNWDKISGLRRFCLLEVKPQDRTISSSVPLGQGTTYRNVDRNIYSDGAEDIVKQTILGYISQYFSGATFVDRDNLSTILKEKSMNLSGITTDELSEIRKIHAIDCLINAKINYAKATLVSNTDAYGGYRYCYVPEVSITVNAIDTRNAEIIIAKTISLNMLQFIQNDLYNECPPDNINGLVQEATTRCLTPFINPIKWELYNLNKSFQQTKDTLSHMSGLKKLLLLEPNCIDCLGNLGWVCLESGKLDEFEKYTSTAYSKIDKEDPLYVWIQFNFAYTMILKNDFRAAEDIIRHAFKISKDKRLFEVLENDFVVLNRYKQFRNGVAVLKDNLLSQ